MGNNIYVTNATTKKVLSNPMAYIFTLLLLLVLGNIAPVTLGIHNVCKYMIIVTNIVIFHLGGGPGFGEESVPVDDAVGFVPLILDGNQCSKE